MKPPYKLLILELFLSAFKVYLLIQRWPGSGVPFVWCGSKVKSASLLANGQFARIEQKGDRVWLHDLPQTTPDPYL